MRLRLVATLGPAGGPLTSWIAGSLAVHLLVFVGIVWYSGLRETRSFDDPYIVTTLLAGPPEPASSGSPPPEEPEPEPEPPPPDPDPEPETDSAVAEEVVPDPDPPEPEPEPEPKPEPPKRRMDREKPSAREPSAGDTGGNHEASATDTSGGSAGIQGLGTRYNYYNQQLVNALLRSWKKPVLAGLRQPLVTVAAYEIANDGSVRNVRIVESSGVPAMDRSVMRAIGEASLPPLPPQLRGAPRPVQSAFELMPDSSF